MSVDSTPSPLISIILPTYNGSAHIDQAIESCVSQTFCDWELIVVDDCSSDNTPAIIAAWMARDARISCVRHDVNRKLPAALNTGLSGAKGHYLTWQSDDNFYLPTALAEMLAYLHEHSGTPMVYSGMKLINSSGEPTGTIITGPPENLLTGNCVGACFLYERDLHRLLGPYAEDLFLAEDYDFWLRISTQFRLGFLNRDLLVYRVHDSSLTALGPARVQPVVTRALLRSIFHIKWANPETRARALLWHARLARLRKDRVQWLQCTFLSIYTCPTLFARAGFNRFRRMTTATSGRST